MAIPTPISYWKLDESSGNALDSVGSNTLTNNNTVAFAAGKINNGANYGTSGTTKSFSNTTPSWFNGSGSFTFNCWVKIEVQPSTNALQTALSINATSSSGKRHFNLDYRDSGGTKQWNLWTGSTGGTEVTYNFTETLSTWIMITLTYNSSDGQLRFYRNEILRITLSTGGTNPSNDKFIIGNVNENGRQLFGSQDEVGYWNVVLSAADITYLYNSGSGRQYPFIIAYLYNVTSIAMTMTLNSIQTAIRYVREVTSIAMTMTLNNVIFGNIYNFTVTSISMVLSINPVSWTLKSWATLTKSVSNWINQSKN